MKKSKPKGSGNCIPNGDFTEGKLGGLPEGWSAKFPRGAQAPVFKLAKKNGKKVLLASGNGSDDCVGCLTAPVSLRGGRTYRMRVRLEMSNGLDPNMNLLFTSSGASGHGIWDTTGTEVTAPQPARAAPPALPRDPARSRALVGRVTPGRHRRRPALLAEDGMAEPCVRT